MQHQQRISARPTRPPSSSREASRSESGVDNARWYDPSLGRFAQADTIVPLQQGVQAWDRYAYVNNSPILYNDPTGHCASVTIVVCIILVVTFVIVVVEIADDAVTHGLRDHRDDLPPIVPENLKYSSPTPSITSDPNYQFTTVDLPSIDIGYPTQPPVNYPPTYSYNAPNSIATPTPCSTVIPTANCIPTPTNTNTLTPTNTNTPTSSATTTSTSTSTITSTYTYVSPTMAMNTQTNTPITLTPTYYPTPNATPTLIPY